jgi:diadenylate cyclase
MAEFFSYLMDNLRMIRIRDFIDVAIVSYAIYKCFKLVRETRAAQLIKGVLILVAITQISDWLDFNVSSYILSNTMQLGFFALVVVFQPELRRILEKMGTTTMSKVFTGIYEEENIHHKICDAVEYMSSQKIGALILMERKTKLGDIMASGTDMNAKVSTELLVNIFTPNTPLHDGATVIGDNVIKSAACFLPLTQNNNLSKEMGTRHRAAVGISEITDCISVVVSEETGTISVACNGEITRNLSPNQLEKYLDKMMQPEKNYDEIMGAKKFWKNWMVNKK